MKTMKKIIISLAAVFVFGLLISGVDANAAVNTVTEKDDKVPQIYEVGNSISLYDVSGLKINGKKVSKMKKKIKTIVMDQDKKGIYIPASYYSQSAYDSYTAYYNAQNGFKYVATTDYNFTFKKAGTYTFKWTTYNVSSQWIDVPGQTYQVLDVKVTKILHTQKYKVVKNANVLKSITLGKAKYTVTRTAKADQSSSGTSVTNRYLKGNSGKVKVSLNSPYTVMSIIVKTYDAEGNAVYQQVKNKGRVMFGNYAYDNSSVNTYNSKYNRTDKSLMKETVVYVAYKNKFTGAYTKHTLMTDAYGNKYIDCQYKYAGDTQLYTGRGLGGNCVLAYTFYKE